MYLRNDTPGRGTFVGRSRELEQIGARADAARRGESSVVWIEGEPGAGKSSLVRRAVAGFAGDFTVVQAVADELSGDLSYTLVAQLGVAPAASPFAAGMALVERLDALQSEQPVVVVVEDFHWADAASRAALLIAIRRLHHDEILVVITSRPEAVDDEWARIVADPDRCLRLRLDGFDAAEVAALARHAAVDLSDEHAERLRRHTGGHPLHLRTLLQELTPAQLTAEGETLPAPRSLASATAAVLASLPRPAQDLAAAVAIFGTPTPLAVAGRVAGVPDPSAALDPLITAGLAVWDSAAEGSPVEIDHPLLRVAIIDDLAPERRRRLHLACAEETRWGASWAHRLAATEGADDDLADELIGGAEFEVARGDLAMASAYLSQAAGVASAQERRDDLVLRSAMLLLHDGQTSRAGALLDRAGDLAPSRRRSLVFGLLAYARADASSAERLLLEVDVADESSDRADRADRAEARAELALLAALLGRADDQVDHARRALELSDPADARTERTAWWAASLGEASLHGAPRGLEVLRERLPESAADVAGVDAELLVARGMLEVCAGAVGPAVEDLRTAFDLARAGWGFRQLPRAHLLLSRALFWRGDWDEAMLQARLAQSLLDEDHPWIGSQAESAMTLVLAARGDFETAERYVLAAFPDAVRLRTVELVTAAHTAAAALAHARGDHRRVVEVLEPLDGDRVTAPAAPVTMLAWWPMLAGSLIEIGELDHAAAQIERIASDGRMWGFRLDAQLADLRARLALARGESAEAVARFAEAVEVVDDDHPILERALLNHRYGLVLRDTGQRRQGEDHLRTAHAILDRLGAVPYRDRVEDDLRTRLSSGRQRRSRQPFDLTARELDVATLAKKGLTNKEIGAELYISAKSVEFHLRNVFAKLMISSRRELRDVELAGDRP